MRAFGGTLVGSCPACSNTSSEVGGWTCALGCLSGGRITPTNWYLTTGGERRYNLYTTPSIGYATLPIYVGNDMFEGGKVTLVLQCRQQPSYQVGPETVNWERTNPGQAVLKISRGTGGKHEDCSMVVSTSVSQGIS